MNTTIHWFKWLFSKKYRRESREWKNTWKAIKQAAEDAAMKARYQR